MSPNRIFISLLIVLAIYVLGAVAISFLPLRPQNVWVAFGAGAILFLIAGIRISPLRRKIQAEYGFETSTIEWPIWAYWAFRLSGAVFMALILYNLLPLFIEENRVQDVYFFGALTGYAISGFYNPKVMDKQNERTNQN
ncbi:MAG: hypothetical protein H6918_11200 [Sphingomonadaceae bacterium]|nr:hypothetical protein [Sphingomonadaceae bacterium]